MRVYFVELLTPQLPNARLWQGKQQCKRGVTTVSNICDRIDDILLLGIPNMSPSGSRTNARRRELFSTIAPAAPLSPHCVSCQMTEICAKTPSYQGHLRVPLSKCTPLGHHWITLPHAINFTRVPQRLINDSQTHRYPSGTTCLRRPCNLQTTAQIGSEKPCMSPLGNTAWD